MLSLDAMNEFRVSTSNHSAEYGRSPGGQFTITSKAGTNAWHGSVTDYVRNNALDANNWFNTYNGCVPVTQNGVTLNAVTSGCLPRNVKQQAEKQNDFGFTLGGPVRIPGLYNGKDRTFFFFSFEDLILQSPTAAQAYNVPSMALRNQASPVFKAFMNAFPVPDAGTDMSGANAGFATVTAGYSIPSRINTSSLRLDHKVNDKISVFARYSRSPSSSNGYCQYCTTSIAEWQAKTNRTTTGTVA